MFQIQMLISFTYSITKCLDIQQVLFNKVTAFVLLVVLEHSLFLMLWKVVVLDVVILEY